MNAVWIVTVEDYEATVIIGVYSSRANAEAAAAQVNVIEHGRFGPYVVPFELDVTKPRGTSEGAVDADEDNPENLSDALDRARTELAAEGRPTHARALIEYLSQGDPTGDPTGEVS